MFALTQVTARLADDLSWGGLLRGLLVLAAIWWAWAAYAWLTNEVDGRRRGVRLVIFGAMIAMLLASLAIPRAFEDDALLFALAYLGVRVAHIGLFAAGTEHVDVRDAARALALDYVGGGLRGIGGWRLSPGHFAERHSLIVIIALGESIVAIGVGAKGIALGGPELLAAALGVIVAASLWWLYFDGALERVEQRLHALPPGRERNTTARDAFSFLHLALVGGIVLLALGVKKTLEQTEDDLELIAALGLCGGIVLSLAADVAFRRRTLGLLERPRLVAAAACAAAFPLATAIPALAALAVVAAICVALVAYESFTPARPAA